MAITHCFPGGSLVICFDGRGDLELMTVQLYPVHVRKQVIRGFGVWTLIGHELSQHTQCLTSSCDILGSDDQVHDAVEIANPSEHRKPQR